MGKLGRPRNRYARPRRAYLFFRPGPEEVPAFWPRDVDGSARWASVLSGPSGWVFTDKPDVLSGGEIKRAYIMFEADYEHIEFREEPVVE